MAKKNIKVRDLKPKKDAKGGGGKPPYIAGSPVAASGSPVGAAGSPTAASGSPKGVI